MSPLSQTLTPTLAAGAARFGDRATEQGAVGDAVRRALRVVRAAAGAEFASLSVARSGSDTLVLACTDGRRPAHERELLVPVLLNGAPGAELRLVRGEGHQAWDSGDWAHAADWCGLMAQTLCSGGEGGSGAPHPSSLVAQDVAMPLLAAMEQWDAGMIVVDADRRIAWANAAFSRLVGIDDHALRGARLPDLYAAHTAIILLRELDAACDLGTDTEFERVLRTDRVQPIRVSVTFDALCAAPGAPQYFVARCIDVTARREREAELRRLSMAVEVSTQGIALVDSARVIRVANPAFARLHAMAGTAGQGQNWFDLLEGHVAGARLADIEFTVESEGSWSGTFELGSAEHPGLVVRQAITRLPDGGWIIAAHDATEQAEWQAALIRARDMAQAAADAQGNFVTVVSHELRTPLNAVIGFSGILRKRLEGQIASRDTELLARIHHNGTALLGIVDAILTHARARAGILTVEPQVVDLALLVGEAAGEYRNDVAPGVGFQVELPSVAIGVTTDGVRFRELVQHLVKNAVKFTAQGAIAVRVRDPGPGAAVLVEVQDTGAGIPASRLPSIFLPFEQADAGTARRYGGTGLGLALVKSLSDLHECEVRVESTEGVGTTFQVVVPARLRTPLPESGEVG